MYLRITLLLFMLMPGFAQAQEVPILQDTQRIRDLGIQSVSVYLRAHEKQQNLDSLKVVQVKLDSLGRISYRKHYRLFDVILYSESYTYTYNDVGRLIEELETMENHPLTAEDSAMLDFIGSESSHRKTRYNYSAAGQLLEKMEYLKSGDVKSTLKTTYHYSKDGKQNKAVYENLRFPEQVSSNNRVEYYTYDQAGRLVLTEMKGTNSSYHQTVELQYDSAGNIISHQRKVNRARITSLTSYQYKDGKLVSSESFKSGANTWHSRTETEYNALGLKVKESNYLQSGLSYWVSFEYNQNGLLVREAHFNAEGIKEFSFETEYHTKD